MRTSVLAGKLAGGRAEGVTRPILASGSTPGFSGLRPRSGDGDTQLSPLDRLEAVGGFERNRSADLVRAGVDGSLRHVVEGLCAKNFGVSEGSCTLPRGRDP